MTRAIALIAALATLALAPAADAARKAPPRFMGMNWDSAISAAPPAVRDAQYPRMAAAGVETVRTVFSWAQAQPTEGGSIDLSATDAYVAATAVRGIEVLPVVMLAPEWARLWPPAASPPKDRSLIAPYAQALVRRYGESGSFWTEHPELPRLPIRYWQFWNEPHLPYQWTLPKHRAKEWPGTYVANLAAFHKAVKEADPRAKVVLAGLANESWKYLGALYRHGARGNFDVAAIHPYTTKPSGVVRLVGRFRSVMRARGDRRMPIWVTELGLPASRGRARSKSPLQTTPRGMASYLSGSYTRLRALTPRVYWYTWASEYRGDIFRFAGLFSYNGGDRQPLAQRAYRAYVATARRLEGCAKTAAGVCG